MYFSRKLLGCLQLYILVVALEYIVTFVKHCNSDGNLVMET